MGSHLTPVASALLRVVAKTSWALAYYRAASSGEKTALHGLYRRGRVSRRLWRGVEGERDAQYEYAIPSILELAAADVRRKAV